ncbi:DUF4283 domain protein, partial [Trifolium medium]|nr:DUF4283 domain protein [Trifolium medium]
ADEVICVEKQKETPSRAGEAVISQDPGTDSPVWSVDRGSGKGDSSILVGDRGSPSICSPADGLRHSVSTAGHGESPPTPCRIKRTKSCPPGVNRSVISGPWSLEWLHDHNQGDAGVIFSASKRSRHGGRGGVPQQKEITEYPQRRKAGGVFRHTLSSLKKVARLPSKDRIEVLKVLKKHERRGRAGTGAHGSRGGSKHGTATASSSSASVNNDWKHWVVVQGRDQIVVDDVKEVGQAIGVHFNGVNENMFSVLSRAGKFKKAASGQTQGGGRVQ